LSWYLDSSAILKLILDEKEREALLGVLDSKSISSRISQLEVKHAVNRIAPGRIMEAQSELVKMDFYPLSNAVLSIAENFPAGVTLRSLDAIHVATALLLDKSIEGIITYDKSMMKNAKALGIKAISPGMK